MTPAFKKFNIFMNKEQIKGKFCITTKNCDNEFKKSDYPKVIPTGTYIMCDFCCDSGMYGIADIDGVLHKVLIPLSNLHNLELI